jgi:hypothetical protein
VICAECGHRIRFDVKEYGGNFFDTRCHRAVITRMFDTLTDAISSNWMMYRISFGTEYRAIWRTKFRALISALLTGKR